MVELWGKQKLVGFEDWPSIGRNMIIRDMFCPSSSTDVAQNQGHVAFYVGLVTERIQQTFQKDRHVQAQEHRPELFWVDAEDLLKIEFNVCSPLVPNPISKLVATVHKSCTSLGQQLKTHKLHLGLHLVLKSWAILGGRRGSLGDRVYIPRSPCPKTN
jgi:hypothetical protein